MMDLGMASGEVETRRAEGGLTRLGILVLLAACLGLSSCGGGSRPTGPSPVAPTLSRTRFLAFGDSFTAGEVTSPISGLPALSHALIVVPAASYPTVLQGRLQATYTAQASSIAVINSGEPNERILDGNQRFPGVFESSRAEVVLIMEGVNGLPLVGPDISTGVMRIMVQTAKSGGARVFVGSMIPQIAGRPRGVTPAFELLAYNTTLQTMATQEGITYVDLYNAMLPEAVTLIGSDGLHPTEAGYRRIADLFFAAIRQELEVR
jgi:lysophospholipase L1-like esterase